MTRADRADFFDCGLGLIIGLRYAGEDLRDLRVYATASLRDQVRHEACVNNKTYVDERATQAKMPISLKNAQLVWRKREAKSLRKRE